MPGVGTPVIERSSSKRSDASELSTWKRPARYPSERRLAPHFVDPVRHAWSSADGPQPSQGSPCSRKLRTSKVK